jgi:hypothetical protein
MKSKDIPAIPDLEETAEPEDLGVQIAEAPEYVLNDYEFV